MWQINLLSNIAHRGQQDEQQDNTEEGKGVAVSQRTNQLRSWNPSEKYCPEPRGTQAICPGTEDSPSGSSGSLRRSPETTQSDTTRSAAHQRLPN